MQLVSVDDIESSPDETGVRHLSQPLGTTDIALNMYRLGPGDSLPAGLHAHYDQEEVFAVLEGELVFETLVPPSADTQPTGLDEYDAREVSVSAGEMIRFGPGDFQTGRNAIEGGTVLLAIGAPKESADIRLPVSCQACGEFPIRLDTSGDELSFECLACGDVVHPAPCPECGAADLRVRLGEDAGTIVECPACGTEYDDPPIRE